MLMMTFYQNLLTVVDFIGMDYSEFIAKMDMPKPHFTNDINNGFVYDWYFADGRIKRVSFVVINGKIANFALSDNDLVYKYRSGILPYDEKTRIKYKDWLKSKKDCDEV